MRIKVQTEPQAEPITLTELKEQLRLRTADVNEDDVLNRLIAVARVHVEKITRRALITQTIDYYFDRFPKTDAIGLPRPPLQSVTTFNYTDTAGDSTAFVEDTDFTVDTDGDPGRVVLVYGQTWPTEILNPQNPIFIRFVCGYGAASTNVPQDIRHAILILASHWYWNRELLARGMTLSPIARTVDDLLNDFIMRSF